MHFIPLKFVDNSLSLNLSQTVHRDKEVKAFSLSNPQGSKGLSSAAPCFQNWGKEEQKDILIN